MHLALCEQKDWDMRWRQPLGRLMQPPPLVTFISIISTQQATRSIMQRWREGRRRLKCKNMRFGQHQKAAARSHPPSLPPSLAPAHSSDTSHGRLIACLRAAEPFVLELHPWS